MNSLVCPFGIRDWGSAAETPLDPEEVVRSAIRMIWLFVWAFQKGVAGIADRYSLAGSANLPRKSTDRCLARTGKP